MKKFLVVLSIFFASFSVFAFSESGSEFEFRVGPKFNIKSYTTQISTGMAIGGEYFKFLVDYSYGGGAHVIRPALLVDIPFYFNVGGDKYFAVGPTVDLGPAFGFGGGVKTIFVVPVGFGVKTFFFFNENIGIAFTPAHFTMSFANAVFGNGAAGFDSLFTMSYDLTFSLILRW